MPASVFSCNEMATLYDGLSTSARDELLQCLLVAACAGGQAMMKVLRQLVLVVSVEAMERDLGLDGPA